MSCNTSATSATKRFKKTSGRFASNVSAFFKNAVMFFQYAFAYKNFAFAYFLWWQIADAVARDVSP